MMKVHIRREKRLDRNSRETSVRGSEILNPPLAGRIPRRYSVLNVVRRRAVDGDDDRIKKKKKK